MIRSTDELISGRGALVSIGTMVVGSLVTLPVLAFFNWEIPLWLIVGTWAGIGSFISHRFFPPSKKQ